MTRKELAQKVLDRLVHLGQESGGLFLPDAWKEVAPALKMLASQIAQSGDRRMLQKEFALDIADSAVDLNTADALLADEPLLITYPFPAVRVGSKEAWFINGKQNLDRKPVTDNQTYYTIHANSLILKRKTAIDDGTGTCLVTADFIPLTENWQPKFEPLMIEAVKALLIPEAQKVA